MKVDPRVAFFSAIRWSARGSWSAPSWSGENAPALVVETEAYLTLNDEACHTFTRPSTRAFVERNAPGAVYIYLNYGVHWMLNRPRERRGAQRLDPDSRARAAPRSGSHESSAAEWTTSAVFAPGPANWRRPWTSRSAITR